MTAGPYPTKEKFQNLEARVDAIRQRDTSVARLTDSGPDSVSLLPASDMALLWAKQVILFYEPTTAEPRLLTEIRLGITNRTAGSTPPSVTVQVGTGIGNLRPVQVFDSEVRSADERTWLCLHVLAELGAYERVWLNFPGSGCEILMRVVNVTGSNVYTSVIGTDGNEYQGDIVNAHLVTEGLRNIYGRLAADAMRVVIYPTDFAKMRDGDFEIVVPARDNANDVNPYCRLKLYDREYRLPFQPYEADGGGLAT